MGTDKDPRWPVVAASREREVSAKNVPGTKLTALPKHLGANSPAYFDDLWWDKNAPYVVRGTIIALTIGGLYRIARSVRLFTQFKQSGDIPDFFIRKNVRLHGYAKRVDAETGVIKVQHEPIIRSWFRRLRPRKNVVDTSEHLQVCVAGVEMTPLARQWLAETFFRDHRHHPHVWFRLLTRSKKITDAVECEISTRRWHYVPLVSLSVNQLLVRRGLGRVLGIDCKSHLQALHTTPAYAKLVDRLITAEQVDVGKTAAHGSVIVAKTSYSVLKRAYFITKTIVITIYSVGSKIWTTGASVAARMRR